MLTRQHAPSSPHNKPSLGVLCYEPVLIPELVTVFGAQDEAWETFGRAAEAKIADIEQKILTLEAMKKILRKMTNRCEGCGPLAECPILETLDEEVSK